MSRSSVYKAVCSRAGLASFRLLEAPLLRLWRGADGLHRVCSRAWRGGDAGCTELSTSPTRDP